MPQYLDTAQGRRIAYHQTLGKGPGVVFLGGLKSDMEGTKAVHLEAWAKAQGRGFLRFDYSGHGQSSGAFDEGCIGDWAEDALEVFDRLTEGPQVLIGSSMGGWQALLLAKRRAARICGLVGIAAAPDFTEDSMWAGFDSAQRSQLMEQGRVELPSEYDEPYIITRRMIEDGRNNLVLRDPLHLPFPARFLQGTEDASVEMSVALRILDHAQGQDIHLTLVKGANHSFSTPECLTLIETAAAEILDECEG